MKLSKTKSISRIKASQDTLHSLCHVMYYVSGILLFVTVISGVVLSNSSTHADITSTKGSTVAVTVDSACTITTGGGNYYRTITPGTSEEIVGNGINVSCNDNNGYALYAIGYSGDSYESPNNTRMLATNNIDYIPTNTSGTGSYWAMKVAGSSDAGSIPVIDNSFNDYHTIPETYTKVSHYDSVTVGTTNNSVTTPTYKINIFSNQTAATYVGKVKYTMVHPTGGAVPTAPITLDSIAETDTSHTMQESIDCLNSTVGTVRTLTDSRDGQKYKVAKAEDGQCWMIENLKLGKTIDTAGESLTLTPANSDTNGNYTLHYSDIPAGGRFHAYTVDDVQYQNNSNEWICRTDWDSCYYNWYTATAGTGTTSITSDNVDASICPAGWALPTQPQFQSLYNQYPSAIQMQVDNPTTTMNNSAGKIPGFLLSGGYYTGGAGYLGSDGLYWSRTAYSAQSTSYLYMNTSSVYPAVNGKYAGFAVRCILNS